MDERIEMLKTFMHIDAGFILIGILILLVCRLIDIFEIKREKKEKDAKERRKGKA